MPALPIFIDTDPGIDDAMAILWLLRSPRARVIGFSTTYGNVDVESTSANLLTLLAAVGGNPPVTIGASAPLALTAPRTGALVHGTDGFWGHGRPHDLAGYPHDVAAAIAAAVRAHPGLTLLALGPLTNIARAVQQFSADLAGVRLVALGGARRGGNTTPVAEYNVYADPLALEVVLASELRVELVTMDAFDHVLIEPAPCLAALRDHGGAAQRLIADLLDGYVEAVKQFDNGIPSIPDAAAAIYTVHPELGYSYDALVRVITDDSYARGQTIIAADRAERLRLVASNDAINEQFDAAQRAGLSFADMTARMLRGVTDNALVVDRIDGAAMSRMLLAGLVD